MQKKPAQIPANWPQARTTYVNQHASPIAAKALAN
jgi:hypothetical protein